MSDRWLGDRLIAAKKVKPREKWFHFVSPKRRPGDPVPRPPWLDALFRGCKAVTAVFVSASILYCIVLQLTWPTPEEIERARQNPPPPSGTLRDWFRHPALPGP